jgi:hypothetical protein
MNNSTFKDLGKNSFLKHRENKRCKTGAIFWLILRILLVYCPTHAESDFRPIMTVSISEGSGSIRPIELQGILTIDSNSSLVFVTDWFTISSASISPTFIKGWFIKSEDSSELAIPINSWFLDLVIFWLVIDLIVFHKSLLLFFDLVNWSVSYCFSVFLANCYSNFCIFCKLLVVSC